MSNVKPSAIQDAKGAYLRNPERKRKKEPKGNKPLKATPPDWLKLTDAEKEVWKQLRKRVLPGVAFDSDEFMFAELVRLMSKSIEREEMTGTERSQLHNLAGKFALTPVDRTRVQVEQAPQDKLSEFLKTRKRQKDPQPAEQSDTVQ